MSYHTSHTLSLQETPSTWGRIRNIDATYDNAVLQVTNRGYTGHEHLLSVALVNMNGRMYDPLLGRMLSPDNYTQAVDMTQNFNRYSYALNNPLKYSDPSGEVFVIDDLIFAAFVGGTINVLIQTMTGNINRWGDFGIAFGIGALSGIAGFGVGQEIASGVGTIGFYGASTTGAGATAAGSFVGGFGNSLMGGASIGDALCQGINAGTFGMVTGGILGGVAGGITSKVHGGNFWTGVGAKFDFSYSIVHDKTDVALPVEYSNKSAKEFSAKYIGNNPKGLNELYANGSMPEGYSLAEGGFGYHPDRGFSQGTTVYLGHGKSDVYLYEVAFQSKERLYLVMQHEYMHVRYFNTGGFNNQAKQEAAARQWMLDQGKAWNYNVDNLQKVYNQTSHNLSYRYHYSHFGIQIQTQKPWVW